MRLEKYHGLGNDFLVLLDLDDRQPVDEATVRALCDRHRGVGADGLMRVTAGPTMELWNADGSRAEMSGNGIRCLVLALVDAGLVPGPEVKVATDAGVRRVTVEADGRLSVDMGAAQFAAGTGVAALVDMGNPHAVVEVQDPYDHDLAREARAYPGLNLELVVARARPRRADHAGLGAGRGGDPGLRHRRLRGGRRRPRMGTRRRQGHGPPAGRRPRSSTSPATPSSSPARRSTSARFMSQAREITLMALIERDRRERIVLVGVAIPPATLDEAESSLDELAAARRHRRGRRGRPRPAAPRRARPGHVRRQGQGRGAARAVVRRRRRHRRLRRRADARPEQQPREDPRPHRHRPHRGDPRHLRPERPHPGGQGPGRAGHAALPAAAAAGQGQGPQPAGRRHRHPARGPGETQLEVDRRRLVRRITKLEGDLQGADQEPPHPAQGPGPLAGPHHRPRRLHQRRQVHAAQPPHRRRGAGRGPAVRHPRPDHAAPGPPRRRAGAAHRHRRVHPQAAPPAGRGLPVDARRGRSRPTCWSTWSTPRRPTPRPRSTRSAPSCGRSAPTRCPSWWRSTRPTWPARRPSACSTATPARWRWRRQTGEGIEEPARGRRRPPAGADQGRRAGRPLRPGRRGSPPSTARARCCPRPTTPTARACGPASSTPSCTASREFLD